MRVVDDRGYAMAALLVGMSVMAVLMSVALPVWSTASQREKEAELIFRGEQYARAVSLFQRRFPGQFPPNLDVLLSGKFLRKRYKDPMTEDGEFQLLLAGQAPPGQALTPADGTPAQIQALIRLRELAQETGGAPGVQAGIMGVVSKSTADSMRLYNGRGKYNEWAFVAVQATTQGGTGGRGTQAPGQVVPGRGGRLQQPGRGAQPAPRGRGGQPQQLPPGAPQPGRGRFNF